jgi:predicted dehydrogenase
MGKRRARNLKALGFSNVSGFDLREDRRKEAETKNGIKTYASFEDACASEHPHAFIISVPPDIHHVYMRVAVEMGIPFFIEASVVDTGMEELTIACKKKNVLAAPSSTMYFHPAIQKIFSLVRSGYLGNLTNVIYHSGQFLPDWHTYEKVSDFYVSKKETGGAREIVPFEMTWLCNLFGFPESVAATVKKTISIEGADEIDDTYNLLFDYRTFTLQLTIDVVSRCATRRLLINGSEKQLTWNWDDNAIRVFHPIKNEWETITYEVLDAAGGYNKNITEQMYIDEMNCFFNAVKGAGEFVNTLESDHRVLRLLYAAEESYRSRKFIQTV